MRSWLQGRLGPGWQKRPSSSPITGPSNTPLCLVLPRVASPAVAVGAPCVVLGHSEEGLRARGPRAALPRVPWRSWFSHPSLSPTGDSLSLEAWRPGLFLPASSLVVLKALSPGGPPPWPALPPASSLGSCLLQESPSKMASRSFISALTPTPGLLAAFWGQHNWGWVSLGISFPRCQKVPDSVFEPPSLLSILPDLGGSCAGSNPRHPCSGSTREPWSQLDPGCPQWECWA